MSCTKSLAGKPCTCKNLYDFIFPQRTNFCLTVLWKLKQNSNNFLQIYYNKLDQFHIQWDHFFLIFIHLIFTMFLSTDQNSEHGNKIYLIVALLQFSVMEKIYTFRYSDQIEGWRMSMMTKSFPTLIWFENKNFVNLRMHIP